MNSPAKRVKCSHDALLPIPPHDVLEVNNTAAVFDWKHADGFLYGGYDPGWCMG